MADRPKFTTVSAEVQDNNKCPTAAASAVQEPLTAENAEFAETTP
jgi:hypothetical protein